MSVLSGARVVLGISGGIAAYKAAELTSKLVQGGATVDVILTAAAREFIGATTFQALTKRPVHGEVFETWSEVSFGHISLAKEAQVLVVAPATAQTIARLAAGFADDMLGAVALSTDAPLIVAPAMEHHMYHHPATQANLTTLRERGMVQVGPATGRLASGYQGDGRMAAPDMILGVIRQVLGRDGALAGRHVVITAGGTQEPIDPVRYIGNRSSGRMGYALAQAAIDAGARVTLISGPSSLTPPPTADVIRIGTAAEMASAVNDAVADADALIMSAAVADFRPRQAHERKIKKGTVDEPSVIELERTTDILATTDRPGLVKIGFAAETDHLLENARQKLDSKGLAMIVANDAVATIGSTESTAILLTPDGPPERLPHQGKTGVAEAIIARLAAMLERPHGRDQP
ncbi:MAG TPA: bifunctional phosphopantothenoylcysteine decarboxylase/phosphopantothenate--cysteine ligase CoaBC [Thermomicrobiales bacterium]|nr:bifunctional phosphopantothenoylcysteine decarboxylase/phosphopantothenate--cysteine ligase CoaBC [Thermomicrobiales bacterium]